MATISFEALEKSELFTTSSKAAKNPDFRGCMIHTERGFGTFQQWWSAVYGYIDRGSYVLLSMKLSTAGPHVVTAYEINDEAVKTYNPDPMSGSQTTWTKHELDGMWNTPEEQVPRLNRDILVVAMPATPLSARVSQEEEATKQQVEKSRPAHKMAQEAKRRQKWR